MAAVILAALVLRDRDTGGHAVCDRREYRSLGASKQPSVSDRPSKAYKDSRWSSVMVRRYGDEYASADIIPFVDEGWVKRLSNLLRSVLREYIEKEPSSKPITTRSVLSSPPDASIAIDIGSRGISSSAQSSVEANSSR